MSQTVRIASATKIYDNDVRAVDRVDLEIKAGEFFTLLGPSGCGKTTLLRMIAGFNTIDEGNIYFNDQVINHIPAHRRNIGMVFQNYAIFPHLSVRENVAYGLKARKIKGAELEKRVNEGLELMAISEYRDRQPSQLSGGQQQRVALARAVVIHPAVLLMDEPLSNLDAKLRVQMRTSIKKLQMGLNITTIYVTHDQEEALAISDRIAVMHDGHVEQVGEPEEIYTRPANTFVANFIGVSGFVDGQAENGQVRIMDKLTLPVRMREGFSGPVTVSIRPEHARIEKEENGPLTGEVSMVTFLGSFVDYEVQLDNGPMIEIKDTRNISSRWKIGERVCIVPDAERITVFEKESGKSVMAY